MPNRPRVLLVTPPMVQVNAPYAATPLLAGCLRACGYEVAQADASLELALRLFAPAGLAAVLRTVRGKFRHRLTPPSVAHFRRHSAAYLATIEPTIRFLQQRDPTLAHRIVTRRFLPEGPRFAVLDTDLPAMAGPAALSVHDQAVYLASLYLDDLTDVIREGVDARFALARYGERLALYAPTFEPLARALRARPTLVDRLTDELARELLARHQPQVVGLTVPFPGTLYGALRMARAIKATAPAVRIVLGGAYVNTELRRLTDPRIFALVDFIILDDGELPLLRLLEFLAGQRQRRELVHTLTLEGRRVVCHGRRSQALADSGTPWFADLPLDRYLTMMEMPNVMHRLWSEARWNRLRLAHGCYWHRCRFCDTTLDHIRRYAPVPISALLDRIAAVISQTGSTGFHFVDEAAPPALLRRLATELLARRLAITWWVNIRFERGFTPSLARLLARAGCIAVTGGLEAANDRLLRVLNKGFTLAEAVQALRSLAQAGIRVHAYLMFGCPTQTEQDTVDALELVRQLFRAGWLHSVYWHRFALTAHSPFARQARRFGLRLLRTPRATFACNEIPFVDRVRCDHAMLGRGLRRATYNYMLGIGLDEDVRIWFDRPVPPPHPLRPA